MFEIDSWESHKCLYNQWSNFFFGLYTPALTCYLSKKGKVAARERERERCLIKTSWTHKISFSIDFLFSSILNLGLHYLFDFLLWLLQRIKNLRVDEFSLSNIDHDTFCVILLNRHGWRSGSHVTSALISQYITRFRHSKW